MQQLFCFLRICYLAVLSIFQLNLGDRVTYKKRTWSLNQGVRDPIWTLIDYYIKPYETAEGKEQRAEGKKLRFGSES